MSRDDVEFLTEDGLVGSEDDDIVEFGHRRVSRRVSTFAGVAVAAVGIALLTARGDHHKSPAPGTPASRLIVSSQPGALPPPFGLGPALPLPASPAVDAVVTPRRLYTLQFSQLTALVGGVAQGVSPDGLDFDRIGGAVRVVVDVPANRLWIVVVNTPNGQILEYDATTLRQLRRTGWPQPIGAATSLDGFLYFSSPAGVAAFLPGERTPQVLSALRGPTGMIVADPRRSRLLVLDYATGSGAGGFRSRVRSYRPGGGLSAGVGQLSFGKGTVAVSGDGTIWAGGFGTAGAVLTRLDPTTLQPGEMSPLASLLGPGADLVAAGQSDIWVRSGTGGTELFCMDGHTGRDNEHWSDLPGRVTSLHGAAYIVSGTTVRPLSIGGCAG